MTSHSNSSSLPADGGANANWTWLQARIAEKGEADQFSHWVEFQLETLESQFEHLMTEKSRSRSLRSELQQDNSRS